MRPVRLWIGGRDQSWPLGRQRSTSRSLSTFAFPSIVVVARAFTTKRLDGFGRALPRSGSRTTAPVPQGMTMTAKVTVPVE